MASERALLLVDARCLFLALYSGLDAAGLGEGHVVELVEAPGIARYSQGAVHPALEADARDFFDAYGFHVLPQPPAAHFHPVGIDTDDVVAVRRGLRYR